MIFHFNPRSEYVLKKCKIQTHPLEIYNNEMIHRILFTKGNL